MANTVAGTHGSGNHASRPAGNAVPDGSLYSCTTHSLIYVSSYGGNSWSTWASLSGTGLSDPMTTRGDIIVRDSSNTTNRLAVGAAGTVLSSDGTDVSWAAPADPAWTSYSPTWTAPSVNPSLGNGTIAAAYLIRGKTYLFRIAVTMGSTTTYGTGRWDFTLGGSVTAAATTQTVACRMLDSSAGTPYGGGAWVTSGASPVVRATSAGAGAINGISSTVPFTWAQSDVLEIGGTIQLA